MSTADRMRAFLARHPRVTFLFSGMLGGMFYLGYEIIRSLTAPAFVSFATTWFSTRPDHLWHSLLLTNLLWSGAASLIMSLLTAGLLYNLLGTQFARYAKLPVVLFIILSYRFLVPFDGHSARMDRYLDDPAFLICPIAALAVYLVVVGIMPHGPRPNASSSAAST